MFPYAEFPASDCLSSDMASANNVNVKHNPLQYVDVFVDNSSNRLLLSAQEFEECGIRGVFD